jgi:hypothetical protein
MNINASIGLAGHEMVHVFLTLIVAGFIYYRYRNWRLVPVVILFGIFIDIDHLYDYFRYFGFQFNTRNFFNVNTYFKPGKTIFVLLHGWEYLLILPFFAKLLEKPLKMPGLALSVFLSYGAHLIFDHFSFPHNLLAYSLIYRYLHQFSQVSFNVYQY